MTAFRDGQVTLRTKRREGGFTFAEKEIGYQGVRVGDLVIHAMDGFAGAIGVSDSDGKCSPVCSVCSPRTDEIEVQYYAALLRHLALSGFISSLAKGIRERSTDFRYSEFKELALPLPPGREQRAIVAFLDRKTTAIDGLIRKKEKLIELLQEKRQALITQAVTRGTKPDVPTKESGVGWLGRIPSTWKTVPLRALSRSGLSNGIFKKKEEFGSGSLLVNVFDVYRPDFLVDFATLERVAVSPSELKRFGVEKQDIFFVRSSLKREGIAKVAYVCDVPEPTVFECHLVRARLREGIVDPAYIAHFLNSDPVRDRLIALSSTTTMTTIGQTCLGSLEVTVPTLAEQQQIVSFLAEKSAHHFNLVAKTRAVVERLREYRQALIAAAVTGRLDILGATS